MFLLVILAPFKMIFKLKETCNHSTKIEKTKDMIINHNGTMTVRDVED